MCCLKSQLSQYYQVHKQYVFLFLLCKINDNHVILVRLQHKTLCLIMKVQKHPSLTSSMLADKAANRISIQLLYRKVLHNNQ